MNIVEMLAPIFESLLILCVTIVIAAGLLFRGLSMLLGRVLGLLYKGCIKHIVIPSLTHIYVTGVQFFYREKNKKLKKYRTN